MIRAAAVLLLIPAAAQAGSFAECIINRMPGADNQVAANIALASCKSAFPDGFDEASRGSGRGLFARYSDGLECASDRTKNTMSTAATNMILKACQHLYDPAVHDPFKAGSE